MVIAGDGFDSDKKQDCASSTHDLDIRSITLSAAKKLMGQRSGSLSKRALQRLNDPIICSETGLILPGTTVANIYGFRIDAILNYNLDGVVYTDRSFNRLYLHPSLVVSELEKLNISAVDLTDFDTYTSTCSVKYRLHECRKLSSEYLVQEGFDKMPKFNQPMYLDRQMSKMMFPKTVEHFDNFSPRLWLEGIDGFNGIHLADAKHRNELYDNYIKNYKE